MDVSASVDLRTLKALGTGLDHPEGVAYGPDGMLYAGGEAGQIYRIDPGDGATEEIANTGGFVLGLAHDAVGNLYVCDAGRQAILRLDRAGNLSTYSESSDAEPLVCPNWLAFGPDGSLWFSDSGEESLDVRAGRLLRVPPDGGTAEVQDMEPLHFSNGLCVDDDGTVYLLESFTPRLHAYADGQLRTVADLPGVVPDGVALDSNGGFVISCYLPYRLLHLAKGASSPTVLVEDPMGITLQMPTNAAFFGVELDQLAIANLGGHNLQTMAAPVTGAPLHRPA